MIFGAYSSNARSRLCDALEHDLIQNIALSPALVLCDRFLHDRTGQAVDLDIHLDGGDTIMGTGHLEVHISEEILQALNIGQYDIIVIGLAGHQTTGNTCYRAS